MLLAGPLGLDGPLTWACTQDGIHEIYNTCLWCALAAHTLVDLALAFFDENVIATEGTTY